MQNRSTSARTAAKYGSKCSLLFRQAPILAILMLAAGLFIGCNDYSYPKQGVFIKEVNGSNIELYVIDSCEYIGRIYGRESDKITHKGNCKNCLIRKK